MADDSTNPIQHGANGQDSDCCPDCSGSGKGFAPVTKTESFIPGMEFTVDDSRKEVPCILCGGTGKISQAAERLLTGEIEPGQHNAGWTP